MQNGYLCSCRERGGRINSFVRVESYPAWNLVNLYNWGLLPRRPNQLSETIHREKLSFSVRLAGV